MTSFLPSDTPEPGDTKGQEFVRFVINGIVATCTHFLVLTFCIEVLKIPSAGVANFIAALFGITASFLGSRYFVFRHHTEGIVHQAVRFVGLYASIACLHAGILFVWTDLLGLDYRLGFLGATGVQMALSYFGNRYLVFKK